MSALSDIQAQVEEAARLERDAAVRLAVLFPPGSPVEFRVGNMACIHNGRVIRVCAWRGLGVQLLNTDTGVERKVPVSALIDVIGDKFDAVRTQISLDPPACELCKTGLEPGETRRECPCGNVFVREGGNNEKTK